MGEGQRTGQFGESLKKWGLGASGVFYCLATRSWFLITESFGIPGKLRTEKSSPAYLVLASPPGGHHRSVLGKAHLLSCWLRANPCPSHFNFLDPLMWNSSVIQFFIFRKKGYWYKSNFLVSFRKVLLRMAFFSGHLSSSPFRTRTQRP